jgi:hypothetical protein
MVAVAIVGVVSGGTIELARRRQRFLRAYREQALAEFECSVKARIIIGTLGGKGIDLPSLSEVASICGLDSEERRLLEGFQTPTLPRTPSDWRQLEFPTWFKNARFRVTLAFFIVGRDRGPRCSRPL